MAQNKRYDIKAYKDYYVVIDTRLGKAEKYIYESKAQTTTREPNEPMSLVDAYLDGY